MPTHVNKDFTVAPFSPGYDFFFFFFFATSVVPRNHFLIKDNSPLVPRADSKLVLSVPLSRERRGQVDLEEEGSVVRSHESNRIRDDKINGIEGNR